MNTVIGYQVAVTQKSFRNFSTIAEARTAFFALALVAGNESIAIYSRLAEGGIGCIVAETLAHYEQGEIKCKKVPFVVLSTERELAKKRLRKAA